MKWLITHLLLWYYNRRWLNKYTELLNVTTEKSLSCALFTKCLEHFNPFMITGVPREYYLEHTVVTSTADITKAHMWLSGYLETLKAYNIYKETTTSVDESDRPDNTYITGYGVELSSPLSINLDIYMSSGGNNYTSVMLLNVLELIKEASAELSKIEDTIDREYFIRRATVVVDDIWAVLSTLISVNKHYA